MKKKIYFGLIFIAILLLAVACSKDTEEQASANETNELPAAEVITQPGEVTPSASQNRQGVESTNLIMAVFQLESTENAISAEQAAELLPLWKVYQSLLESSTAAEAEREALISQIAGVLTDDQAALVEAGEFDIEEVNALMAELGIETSLGGGMGMGERPAAENGEVPKDTGVIPGTGQGGGPGGGLGGGMGASMDPEQLATLQAERAENGGGIRGGGQMDEVLLPVLIEFLEAKINS